MLALDFACGAFFHAEMGAMNRSAQLSRSSGFALADSTPCIIRSSKGAPCEKRGQPFKG